MLKLIGKKIFTILSSTILFVLTYAMLSSQGFSLALALGHSLKIVPDVREFTVQFVRDNFRERTLYSIVQ